MIRTTSAVSLADWQDEHGPNRVELYRSVTADLSPDLSLIQRRAWSEHVRFQIEDLGEETSVDLYLDKYGIAAIRAMLDEAEKALEREPASSIDDPQLDGETEWSSLTITDLEQYGAPGDYLLPLVDRAEVARDLYRAIVSARAAGTSAGYALDPSTGTRYRGVILTPEAYAEQGMTTPVDIQVEVRP